MESKAQTPAGLSRTVNQIPGFFLLPMEEAKGIPRLYA
jgi:hypothetical protein